MAKKTSSQARRASGGGLAVAIMAAGKGTRLKSKHPKVLHEVGGKPMLAHVIGAAARVVAPRHIYVIIGHEAERVRAAVAHSGVKFAIQKPQRGTGHAMMVAANQLAIYEHVLVLSGDVPLIQVETLERLRDFHLQQRAAMTILTAEPAEPYGYGRVIRKSAQSAGVTAIVEQKALQGAHLKAREINSGIYAFAVGELLPQLGRLKTDNAHREYYLTDVAALLVKAKRKVVALRAESFAEVTGSNTRAELAQIDDEMRRRKATELMGAGVTILSPATVRVDADVKVGADTVIEPFVQLLGRTKIGADCRIRSYSVISDSDIAAGVTVRFGSIIDQARVSKGAIIGPYSHLRPGSEIGEGAHVGNFVETKKARLGKGSKANHLTYLGDAEIGEGVNVGAGTITCNYDGVNKHTTRIEDGAFIGSDSTLVAPVTIGKGAYVGAASCITEDVPAESLAIGRARQTVKQGWVREKKKR
jgi:bifunctional UDP-N-acetylglucosamine pyrophosphorylase/glucosamine-1-phosphate N-acetyltransferase